MLLGHQAWVHWRDDKLTEAQSVAQEALALGQQQKAFLWTSLWVLFGLAFQQNQLQQAMAYANDLRSVDLQPPPARLDRLLEFALQIWEAGRQEEVLAHCRDITRLAGELGYL